MKDLDIREVWRDDIGTLAKALKPGAGFAFTYDGRIAGPELDSEWQVTLEQGISHSAYGKAVLSHPSGLQVTREARVFSQFAAVEYTLRFKNTAKTALPTLSAIHALHISMGEPALDGNCVVSSTGGLHDTLLPPQGWALRKNCFVSQAHGQLSLDLTTKGGRSSNQDLPFLFVHNDRLNEGLFVAFGWSGQWAMQAELDRSAGTFTLRGKIPELHIALEPGEEIQGPTVLIGLYQGELSVGSNRLRRLIREHYTPTLAGHPYLPVTTYSNWFDLWGFFDEAQLKKTIDAVAALDQEYFLLDAGWYAGASEQQGGFSAGLGNWEQVDRRKLPNGLKPIAEYVRSKGLQFGLWFEPERIAEGSQLAQEHPEWILWAPEPEPMLWWQETSSDYPYFRGRVGLLDFGRPEVQAWVRTMMDRYIKELGIKYVRHDFNIDPLAYWDANDPPNRRGMTQIGYVRGLYTVVDWLREQNPDTIFEGCASGGLRIDLEMARRYHTFWISDNHADTAISRFHLHGINHFLPGNYHVVTYLLPLAHRRQPALAGPDLQFHADDLGLQSLFGGAFGTGGRVDLWSAQDMQKAHPHVEVYKRLRRYLVEDYYPLMDQPADLKCWSGWQFHDPQDQSGFIQTFRTQTEDAPRYFVIRGLEEGARYRFTDPYTHEAYEAMELSGSSAMIHGIRFMQEPMSSKLLMYRKI